MCDRIFVTYPFKYLHIFIVLFVFLPGFTIVLLTWSHFYLLFVFIVLPFLLLRIAIICIFLRNFKTHFTFFVVNFLSSLPEGRQLQFLFFVSFLFFLLLSVCQFKTSCHFIPFLMSWPNCIVVAQDVFSMGSGLKGYFLWNLKGISFFRVS